MMLMYFQSFPSLGSLSTFDLKMYSIQCVKKQPFKVSGRPIAIKAGEQQSDVMTMSYDPEGKHLAVGK